MTIITKGKKEYITSKRSVNDERQSKIILLQGHEGKAPGVTAGVICAYVQMK